MQEYRKKLMIACEMIDDVADALPEDKVFDDAVFALKGAISNIYDADEILEDNE